MLFHINRLNYRDFSVKWLPNFICKWIEKYWISSLIRELKKLARFVVLTHEDAEMWPEVNNLRVIPNPVAFFPDSTSSNKNKQVIAVGRFFEQKGFDLLISKTFIKLVFLLMSTQKGAFQNLVFLIIFFIQKNQSL